MECRHSLGQPLMMDHEQIWNHPCCDPPLTMGTTCSGRTKGKLNVSTGMSEDAISSCLMEAHHCCDQRLDEYEEGHCIVICLESYKHRERLGKLKCGHDFHACCIKLQWLLIKNICKALALEDS